MRKLYNEVDSQGSLHNYSSMCYWRRVRNIYKHCGHAVNQPDEEIKCDMTTCIFSPAHPEDCLGCSKTCWQYHQYPQQYSPHVDRLCPACTAAQA
ncbi:hypothetical protein L208DRAFT_1430084 [Tricholoma matsutake]|nr:hypothetical protein L208DRAFT_1430084 [Tricholoma matsutake 945]